MRIALLTGSFDPVTTGHEDLILRSAAMFDEIYVVILANTEKKQGITTLPKRMAPMEAKVKLSVWYMP